MKISDLIDALKAFFLDFLGYFLPGVYALLVLTYIVEEKWKLTFMGNYPFLEEYYGIIFFTFAYILGYVVYSISLADWIAKRKFLKIKTSSQIEGEIRSGLEFEQCKKVISKLWVENNASVLSANDLSNLNTRNLRSIVMSYIPESDVKIYTFMFRSDLCKHISSFSLLCGILGLFFSSLSLVFDHIKVFKIGWHYTMLYALLLICSFFLVKTRSRFLSIAYKIPFSMFLSKYYKIP